MSGSRAGTVERMLAWAHIGMAALIVPMAGAFGLWFALVLIAGPVWLVGLGVRLLRPSPEAWTMARRTHMFAGPAAIIFGLYGIFALRAAARSADQGGGLLGAFGIYPLVLALGLGALSAVTLVLSWREGRT